jgi:hypothetical protein
MSEKGNSTKKGIAIAKPARTVNKRTFIDGSTRSHVILNHQPFPNLQDNDRYQLTKY